MFNRIPSGGTAWHYTGFATLEELMTSLVGDVALNDDGLEALVSGGRSPDVLARLKYINGAWTTNGQLSHHMD